TPRLELGVVSPPRPDARPPPAVRSSLPPPGQDCAGKARARKSCESSLRGAPAGVGFFDDPGGLLWAPGAGLVVRELRWGRRRPGVHDRGEDVPGLLDPVAAREER